MTGKQRQLPNDVARCNGAGWEECEDCLRRTSNPSEDQCIMISPPEIVVFECEFYVDPKLKKPAD